MIAYIIGKKYKKGWTLGNKARYLWEKLWSHIEWEKIENGIKITVIESKVEKKTGVKKLVEILKQNQVNNIVLDRELKKNEELKNRLYEDGCSIITGQFWFEVHLLKIIDFIMEKAEEKIENQEITILLNNKNSMQEYMIYELAKKAKRISIITNHISKFKNLEKELYEELGIMISVANNKRKSLAKAKLIINMDFPMELINQYRINRNAIIINWEPQVKIKTKAFSGVLIHDIKMSKRVSKIGWEEKFEENELYEAELLSIHYEKDRLEKIEKEKNVIKSLIGINGIISQGELEFTKKSQEILDKNSFLS